MRPLRPGACAPSGLSGAEHAVKVYVLVRYGYADPDEVVGVFSDLSKAEEAIGHPLKWRFESRWGAMDYYVQEFEVQ